MKVVKPKPFPRERQLQSATQLGAALCAARTQAGLTLSDAAIALGMAKQTLADLERGTGSVGLSKVLTACEGLGVALFMVPATQRSRAQLALDALKPEEDRDGV